MKSFMGKGVAIILLSASLALSSLCPVLAEGTVSVSGNDPGTGYLIKRIGNTTFDIHIYFSKTSRETFTDKVVRLIENDNGTVTD